MWTIGILTLFVTTTYAAGGLWVSANDGQISWGVDKDTTLYRVASNLLGTDGVLKVGGALKVGAAQTDVETELASLKAEVTTLQSVLGSLAQVAGTVGMALQVSEELKVTGRTDAQGIVFQNLGEFRVLHRGSGREDETLMPSFLTPPWMAANRGTTFMWTEKVPSFADIVMCNNGNDPGIFVYPKPSGYEGQYTATVGYGYPVGGTTEAELLHVEFSGWETGVKDASNTEVISTGVSSIHATLALDVNTWIWNVDQMTIRVGGAFFRCY